MSSDGRPGDGLGLGSIDQSEYVEVADSDFEAPGVSQPVQVVEPEWPKVALVTAFKVIKLIADEFLDSMGLPVIGEVIKCLYSFAAQTSDVNISLTSIEVLWKVSDVAMSLPAFPLHPVAPVNPVSPVSPVLLETGVTAGSFEIFQLMLGCLEELSVDPRPEVRKSAINTLFSSLTAHASSNLLSSAQLRSVCQESVFSLFQLQLKTDSTRKACSKNSNDMTATPELKKGIKMNVHHSRDTVNKQWSETRTLSLRGLSRLLRTITKGLLLECDIWFKNEMWIKVLDLSQISIEMVGDNSAENNNTEVSLAAIDLLFAMLKTVSIPPTPTSTSTSTSVGSIIQSKSVLIHNNNNNKNNSSNNNNNDNNNNNNKTKIKVTVDDMVAEKESARDDLWQATWRALRKAVSVKCLTPELALHFCQSLSGLYTSSFDAEFRYSANIQILLEMVVVLSRPRPIENKNKNTNINTKINNNDKYESNKPLSVTDIQLHRAVISLLKGIKAVDSLAFLSLISCLSELSFAFKPVLMLTHDPSQDSTQDPPILLRPTDEKLRIAAKNIYLKY